jgi:hypothetical protein
MLLLDVVAPPLPAVGVVSVLYMIFIVITFSLPTEYPVDQKSEYKRYPHLCLIMQVDDRQGCGRPTAAAASDPTSAFTC